MAAEFVRLSSVGSKATVGDSGSPASPTESGESGVRRALTIRPAGIIVFLGRLALALVGTEVLRRQTAAEFPDTHAGAGTVTAAASQGGHE